MVSPSDLAVSLMFFRWCQSGFAQNPNGFISKLSRVARSGYGMRIINWSASRLGDGSLRPQRIVLLFPRISRPVCIRRVVPLLHVYRGPFTPLAKLLIPLVVAVTFVVAYAFTAALHVAPIIWIGAVSPASAFVAFRVNAGALAVTPSLKFTFHICLRFSPTSAPQKTPPLAP